MTDNNIFVEWPRDCINTQNVTFFMIALHIMPACKNYYKHLLLIRKDLFQRFFDFSPLVITSSKMYSTYVCFQSKYIFGELYTIAGEQGWVIRVISPSSRKTIEACFRLVFRRAIAELTTATLTLNIPPSVSCKQKT